jgi:hypothetical protein
MKKNISSIKNSASCFKRLSVKYNYHWLSSISSKNISLTLTLASAIKISLPKMSPKRPTLSTTQSAPKIPRNNWHMYYGHYTNFCIFWAHLCTLKLTFMSCLI